MFSPLSLLRAWVGNLVDDALDAIFIWALYRDVKGPRRPPPRARGTNGRDA